MKDLEKRLVETEYVLNKLDEKYKKRIPNKVWKFIKNNKSKYYTYKYENNHMLNLDTICILTYINMQYIMNYKQKKVMIDILKLDKKHIK